MSKKNYPEDNEFPKLYSPQEVGRLFKVDPRTVGRWAQTGKIKAVRTPGGHTRFPEHAINAISNGVCRNCSTLRLDDGSCNCG